MLCREWPWFSSELRGLRNLHSWAFVAKHARSQKTIKVSNTIKESFQICHIQQEHYPLISGFWESRGLIDLNFEKERKKNPIFYGFLHGLHRFQFQTEPFIPAINNIKQTQLSNFMHVRIARNLRDLTCLSVIIVPCLRMLSVAWRHILYGDLRGEMASTSGTSPLGQMKVSPSHGWPFFWKWSYKKQIMTTWIIPTVAQSRLNAWLPFVLWLSQNFYLNFSHN